MKTSAQLWPTSSQAEEKSTRSLNTSSASERSSLELAGCRVRARAGAEVRTLGLGLGLGLGSFAAHYAGPTGIGLYPIFSQSPRYSPHLLATYYWLLLTLTMRPQPLRRICTAASWVELGFRAGLGLGLKL